jgi:hypothetical protein
MTRHLFGGACRPPSVEMRRTPASHTSWKSADLFVVRQRRIAQFQQERHQVTDIALPANEVRQMIAGIRTNTGATSPAFAPLSSNGV